MGVGREGRLVAQLLCREQSSQGLASQSLQNLFYERRASNPAPCPRWRPWEGTHLPCPGSCVSSSFLRSLHTHMYVHVYTQPLVCTRLFAHPSRAQGQPLCQGAVRQAQSWCPQGVGWGLEGTCFTFP